METLESHDLELSHLNISTRRTRQKQAGRLVPQHSGSLSLQIQTKVLTCYRNVYLWICDLIQSKEYRIENMVKVLVLCFSVPPQVHVRQSIVLLYKNEHKLQLLRKYQQVRGLHWNITP